MVVCVASISSSYATSSAVPELSSHPGDGNLELLNSKGENHPSCDDVPIALDRAARTVVVHLLIANPKWTEMVHALLKMTHCRSHDEGSDGTPRSAR